MEKEAVLLPSLGLVPRTRVRETDPGKARVSEPEGSVAGIPELTLEKVLFSSANVSQEKISFRLDLILTPNDLNQICKNYSYNRAL